MGPVSVYGGGTRRRRRSSGGGLGVVVVVLIAIGLAIEYWMYVVPIAVVLTVGAILVARDNRRRAEKRHQAWLAGPPPPLEFPGRFTQTWFVKNGSYLHPGQIPILFRELRRRGWTDEDIATRAAPYLPSSS